MERAPARSSVLVGGGVDTGPLVRGVPELAPQPPVAGSPRLLLVPVATGLGSLAQSAPIRGVERGTQPRARPADDDGRAVPEAGPGAPSHE